MPLGSSEQRDPVGLSFREVLLAALRIRRVRWALIGLMALLAIAWFNCRWARQASPPISGVVVDAEGGKPIAMAAVLVEWHGRQVGPWFPVWAPGYHSSGSLCYHLEFAVTNDAGRYHIPGWRQFGPFGAFNGIKHEYTVVRVFRSGFAPYDDVLSRSVKLHRLQGAAPDLIKSLGELQKHDRCITLPRNGSARNLSAFALLLYNAAEAHATSELDKAILDDVQLDAERAQDVEAH